jgi:hypothetical protein
MPYRGERWPVPALLLVSTDGGNLYAEQLLDDRLFQTTKLFVEAFEPGMTLPPHRIVFNAIADADRNQATLARAGSILQQTNARVLNDPSRVAATGRAEVARRLAHVEGVRTPRIAAFDPHRPPAFPFLLRVSGFHMGRHFVRVDDVASLAQARAALPAKRLDCIEYLDTRSSDGWFRKYRVIMVSGGIYPLHLAVAREWKVHYFSSAMFDVEAFRHEERAFLEDMVAAIGNPAARALQAIADELGLDYGGIDFGIDGAGKLVVFEANAAMTVIPPDDDERFVYRRGPTERVLEAMRRLTMEDG